MVMRPTAVVFAHDLRIAFKQRVLGLGIERRGWFVEDQHERPVAHEAARERQLLPLTEAHLHAARPRGSELRLQACRQARDHVVSARTARWP